MSMMPSVNDNNCMEYMDLWSHLFEPEKVVAFTSFSTNFTFFPLKTPTNFHQNTENESFGRKRHYCNFCVSRTLKCNACSRHDVALRREYQNTHYHKSKTSNSTKTSTVVKDFFSSNLFQIDSSG